jgi:hypothetical protein
MKANAPPATAVREVDERTLRAVASAPFLSRVTGQRFPFAHLDAAIAEQESQAVEAPRRRAILTALYYAFQGHEVSRFDFDTARPENIAAYREALDDVRSEVACNGRVIRAAAAILALDRLRGKAVQ